MSRIVDVIFRSQPQVFLSYSRFDERRVKELRKDLSEQGFLVWMDRPRLTGGDNFTREIKQAIEGSDLFIACLSKAMVNALKRHSSKSYVWKEIKYALKLKDDEFYNLPVIPARLAECRVLKMLSAIHCVDLFLADGMENLLKALNKYKPKSQVDLHLDKDIERFNETEQRLLLRALSAQLEVPEDDLSIVEGIERGSKRITVKLPAQSAAKLQKIYKEPDFVKLIDAYQQLANPIDLKLHSILAEFYDSIDLEVLCRSIGIPPAAVVIQGRNIEDAAAEVISYCNQLPVKGSATNTSIKDSLISTVISEHPHRDAVKEIKELLAKKYALISVTPDLMESYVKSRIGNPQIISTNREIIPPSPGHTVIYYQELRAKMDECSTFIGLIGRDLGPLIQDLGRTQFEVEYDAAFMRGIPAYLFILEDVKEEAFAETRSEFVEKVIRMRKLQICNITKGENIFYYKNDLDLFVRLRDLLLTLQHYAEQSEFK